MAPVITPQSSMALTPMASVGQGVQLGMQPQQGPGSIPLSQLLDFLIQKTYHELTVLSELLPRKMDMERKEEIVKFAHSTRQSFIRFLALVKWAGSAAKVDKCTAISNFLDHQSLLFVDTADMLSRMARENLVNARLPNFCLPHAVDVLTLGQYKRLPTCIKEKIIPPDPITPQEKASVLGRLDQIIQHRLVTSQLPSQLSNLSIKEGRVKFHVPQEFEATLTLMEDNPTIPWRLLNIKILVQDPDTGEGKALVHPMQVTYIHQLVQSRLFGDDKPLLDMYSCLHTFCQSLQLEVLHSQAQRLVRERWGEHVMVEKYIPGQSLPLAYWRAQNLNSTKKQEHYKVVVCIDNNDAAKPLQVIHNPVLEAEDADRICFASIKCERLSIERLLVETILVRSRIKLQSLKEALEKINIKATVKGTPPLLFIPVMDAADDSEDDIRVSVDLQTGALEPSVAHCDDAMLDDIDISLTSDLSKLPNLLTKIRLTHCVEKFKMSIQTMPVSCSDTIPLIPLQPEHPLSKLSPTRLYVYLKKHVSYYVVVEFAPPKDEQSIAVSIRYFLLKVRPAYTFETASLPQPADSVPTNLQYQETSRVFYAPVSLVQIDSFAAIYGPGTCVEEFMTTPGGKRSFQSTDSVHKKPRAMDNRCEKDLPHIIALCDGRVPFIKLSEELRKKSIPHQGIQTDINSTGLVLKLCQVPPCASVSKDTNTALASALLSCSFRILQKKDQGLWQVELIFCKCPVVSSAPKEQGPLQHIYLNYEMNPAVSVLDQFFQDWESIANLYELVLGLPCVLPYLTLTPSARTGWLQEHTLPYSILVDIVSYTYQKITVAYNKDKTHVVTVRWDNKSKEFKLLFGVVGPRSATNCHSLLKHCLQQELNEHKALPVLLRVLCNTQSPLQAICKLPIMTIVRSSANGALSPAFSFVLLPQSSNHFRLIYGSYFCLEIVCKGKNAVTIKDGSFSHFNIRTHIDGFLPIQGLKAFLDLYVDETTSHPRRHTITEDDPPCSPLPMDTLPPQADPFMSAPPQLPATAASPMYNQKIGTPGATGGFAHPSSNPATPSSPHTSVLPPQQYSMSPGASAYPLASPPTIIPSPSGVMRGSAPSPALATGSPHHVPSPSSSFIHTPPPNIQLSSPGQFISPTNVGGDVASSTGSPFPGSVGYPAPSPGQRNWPASPSLQGPSPIQRLVQSPGSAGGITQQSPGSGSIPQSSGIPRHSKTLSYRTGAATLSTLLSHDALHKLFTPSLIPGLSTNLCSPLERYLGAAFLRRQLQRLLQNPDAALNSLQIINTTEIGVIQFRSESLQYRIALNTATMQYLQLQVKATEEKEQFWTQDEFRILEKYFETKVACPPFKFNNLMSFIRLQTVTTSILKDFIKLLHLELRPDQSLKWQLEWCLTIHPCDLTTPGTTAFIIKQKILFFIKLTCINPAPPPGQEPLFETVGIVYDRNTNTTSAVSLVKRSSANHNTISTLLKQWNDYNLNKTECSLYPSIRSLMSTLQLKS
ncbi:Mediator of RNA polymerase II transcription subunit 14 [Holothuria leucospilota]|uniref:Mediator of RNA polymerase II transcription subunit 14 n=1 Tax=Holothuria leucospilota TaxID=206669 RepID=A0A9Q1BQD3_HOLLE|nr:Mediator of RNA polymerase II transcription subunit 14 [Holothuria leucospilota]